MSTCIDNPKLRAALEAGARKYEEKRAARIEEAIQWRTSEYLRNDFIYSLITEAVGRGESVLELYSHLYQDDAEQAGWSATAINRIPGLCASVRTYQDRKSLGGPYETMFYIQVAWETPRPAPTAIPDYGFDIDDGRAAADIAASHALRDRY